MKKTITLAIVAGLIYACGGNQSSKTSESAKSDTVQTDELLTQAQGVFKTLPAKAENSENEMSDAKIELGKLLYFDTRLSKTGHNSCNSCHNLGTFGVDNKSFSEGDAGKLGGRNSPSTFNAALHSSQFWDGRAKDVEEQAGMPVMNPVEMAIPNEDFLVKRLAGVSMYQEKFKAAFPSDAKALTYKNIAKAIAAFERTLITPSKFDTYLGGDITALNDSEKEGLKTFMNAGCTACHNGATIGGTQLMKFGLINDYHPLTKSTNKDNGLMDQTKKEADKDIFKVASLRNVEKTHPYFHDGSVADLKVAIKVMAKAQLNKDLTDQEVSSIETFLKTLTSDIPEETKKAPAELASK
ncbi:MAG: cytochrome-c peroxidase [Bacteroidetes bacterium B1(2017)]|nr:MAG: cytochrome-c peroxidase [Bacteroidetes bacterium B1(2017)]